METQEDVASGYGKIIALLSSARVVPLRMRGRAERARKVSRRAWDSKIAKKHTTAMFLVRGGILQQRKPYVPM